MGARFLGRRVRYAFHRLLVFEQLDVKCTGSSVLRARLRKGTANRTVGRPPGLGVGPVHRQARDAELQLRVLSGSAERRSARTPQVGGTPRRIACTSANCSRNGPPRESSRSNRRSVSKPK